MPISAEHTSRNLRVARRPTLWFGRSVEAPVHIPPWRQDGWLVQSWLPPCSSCRERGIPKMHCSEQSSLISVASFTLFTDIPWLAVSIGWGLDGIAVAIWIIQSNYAIISLFLGGVGKFGIQDPSRTFLFLMSLSQTWLQRLNVWITKCTLYWGLPINQQGRYVKHRKISTAVLLLILLVI